MASLINNENVKEETKPYYYGWYSPKMKIDKLNRNMLRLNDDYTQCNYIYYKDYNNNIVEVTYVSKEKEHNLKWDDLVFVGELKEFYKSTSKSINTKKNII